MFFTLKKYAALILELTLLIILIFPKNFVAQSDSVQTDVPALKDVYANDFYIGCLLSYAHVGFPSDPYVPGQSNIVAPNGGNLIKYHMNSMSPGNWMKPAYIVDIVGSASDYNSASTQEEKDSIDVNPIIQFNGNIIAQLNWAKRQGFTFRGHTLVWHNQTPGTAFFRTGYSSSGAYLSKEKILQRMDNFIKEVIRILHEGWPGLVTAMDVVNEAVSDDGSDRTSNNEWYTVFGDLNYIPEAFASVRKHTENYGETQMKLYYNDYNTHLSAKADGIVRICQPIYEAGNLDGIGMQDHDGNNYPSAEEWITTYNKFEPICDEISVTELDVTTGSANPSPSLLQTQANQYSQLFKCFVERSYFSGRGKIITVAKDGLNDEWTFKKNQASSLWDANNKCKPAFYDVVDVGNSYNGLDTLIDYTKTLNETDYTPESWQMLEFAIDSTITKMSQNYSASLSAADALRNAYILLNSAIESLSYITEPIVRNGSFEETSPGIVDLDGIVGWVIEVGAAVNPVPVFEVVQNNPPDGDNSLKIVVNAAGSDPWNIQVVADSLPVESGESYLMTLWAKSSNTGSQANFTTGNYDYSEYGALRPVNLTTDWRQYSLPFTISDSEIFIRAPLHFSLSGNVGDSIFIDNLKVEKPQSSWDGPPLADGQPKFLGCAYSTDQAPNFDFYWNQVTPENAGKWGSVEGSRDNMNWIGLDAAYNLAKSNGLPFRFHVLIWGNQQPSWIENLSTEEQLVEIREWFEAVAERYPQIEYLEVVNEPLHDPPRGVGNGNYIDALGGDGDTGWDWVLNAFRMAREIFPSTTKLMINDYSIVNSSTNVFNYIKIIDLLKAENLIDAIGAQGHAFSTRGSAAEMKQNLDLLSGTGLPIHITEMDIDGPTDQIQLSDYQRIFSTFWEHRGVVGITLWGWRPGLWRDAEGAYIIFESGVERPALEWLREYTSIPIAQIPLTPIIISPNNVTDLPRNPVLLWYTSLSATSYDVQVSTNSAFSQIILDTTVIDTSFQLNTLSANTMHYWRVAAKNDDGSSSFSQSASFMTGDQITNVFVAEEIPREFQLFQNYPNPFNPSTKIRYHIPFASYVSLKVYDMLGREVMQIVNGNLQPGKYKVALNAEKLSSGMYLYQIKTDSFADTKKMILLK